MTDVFDRASDREQLDRDMAIRFSRKTQALPATGACHFCGEPLDMPSHRFCDSFCRDDYEKKEAARLRNGG